MSPNDLLRLTRQKPFEPFKITVSDGREYEIRHPEMLVVGVRTSFIPLPSPDVPGMMDDFALVDNLHITRTESLSAFTD